MSSREELRNQLQAGLVRDIFKMERAYFLIQEISAKGSDIDKNHDYIELFQIIQNSLLTEAVMAVSRIYDKPSKKYPTNCLQSILSFIENNVNNLIPIIEKPNLQRHLYKIDAPDYLISSLNKDNDILYTQMLVEHFKILCFTGENKDRILKLKNIRDKRIAHNENNPIINNPTLIDLKDLIKNTQKVIGTIGWSYLSPAQVYIIEGKYLLSDDARRVSVSLKKLLDTVLN
ncbi:MAG: hypothetical protein AAFQ80_18945 [Cyanobacteria bacterium J06621_8]